MSGRAIDNLRLSEALAGATPETLREDARLLLDVFRDIEPSTREDAAWMRAAALALTIAEWSERPARILSEEAWDDDNDRPSWSVRIPMTDHYRHCPTLPAALAVFLKDITP